MNLVAFASLRPLTRCMRALRTTSVCLIACAAVAAGCSSSSSDDASPATTVDATTITTAAPASTGTIEPTTSTTVEPAPAIPTDEELTIAVEEFWNLFVELGSSTAPFDPVAVRARLEDRTTGDQLAQLFDVLQSNALSGYTVKGDISSSVTIVSAAETEAQVRDCYDDTTGLYDIESGERLDTDKPDRHQMLFVLLNEDGVWKVAQARDEGDGCIVSS